MFLHPPPTSPLAPETAHNALAKVLAYDRQRERLRHLRLAPLLPAGLCQLLVDTSKVVVADRPDEALELTELALQVAWRAREEGEAAPAVEEAVIYTWTHRAEAHICSNEPAEAESCLQAALTVSGKLARIGPYIAAELELAAAGISLLWHEKAIADQQASTALEDYEAAGAAHMVTYCRLFKIAIWRNAAARSRMLQEHPLELPPGCSRVAGLPADFASKFLICEQDLHQGLNVLRSYRRLFDASGRHHG